jgi:anti-anti-sigma regulatory factor
MALAPGDRLEVFHSRSDNSEVIVCRGWLDESTCDQLQDLLDEAMRDRVARLRVDLSSVLGVDDAGIRCLLTTSERCRAFGIQLELEANRPIRSALTAYGAGRLARG